MCVTIGQIWANFFDVISERPLIILPTMKNECERNIIVHTNDGMLILPPLPYFSCSKM